MSEKKSFNRRGFLKSTVAETAGFFISAYVIATKVPGSVPKPYRDGKFPDDEASRKRLGEDFLSRFHQSLKDHLGLEYDVCEGCPHCPVRCAKGFPVAMKIKDIARLQKVPTEFIV